MSVWNYFIYLVKKHLFSWRMLAVLIVTVLTMDTFFSPIRAYCHSEDLKMSQWGFALVWDNKYYGLCFLLIFVFAISVIPEDRKKDVYILTRIGMEKWVLGQYLFLCFFSMVYTVFLALLHNVLLWNVLEMDTEWGLGWEFLSNKDVIRKYDLLTPTARRVLANYEPLAANLLVLGILFLVLCAVGALMFWLNFYSRAAGALGATALIFLSLAAEKKSSWVRYSPVSWLNLDRHYMLVAPELPHLSYILGILVLINVLCVILADIFANQTQEDNKKGIRHGR